MPGAGRVDVLRGVPPLTRTELWISNPDSLALGGTTLIHVSMILQRVSSRMEPPVQ